jgi:ribosomal protein S18 acetylase RimI-like enzyme
MDSQPVIFDQPIDGSTILKILRSHLPKSLPLYRRIQSTRRTPESQIFASFSPETASTNIPSCFCIAFVDRSLRPETELFLYLYNKSDSEPQACEECSRILHALLMKAAELPVTLRELPIPATSKFGAHLSNTKLLLAGAVEEETAKIIENLGLLDPNLPSMNSPYAKYIFREENLPTQNIPELPDGLRWGRLVEQEHLELVVSRTEIPRQVKTLAALESVGVFDKGTGKPIAWTFLSSDGSMSTLHVEEAWRRRGIAKSLATKVVRQSMGDEGFGRADIAVDNDASRRVCESIGGKEESIVYWLRIDLNKVTAEGTGSE